MQTKLPSAAIKIDTCRSFFYLLRNFLIFNLQFKKWPKMVRESRNDNFLIRLDLDKKNQFLTSISHFQTSLKLSWRKLFFFSLLLKHFFAQYLTQKLVTASILFINFIYFSSQPFSDRVKHTFELARHTKNKTKICASWKWSFFLLL